MIENVPSALFWNDVRFVTLLCKGWKSHIMSLHSAMRWFPIETDGNKLYCSFRTVSFGNSSQCLKSKLSLELSLQWITIHYVLSLLDWISLYPCWLCTTMQLDIGYQCTPHLFVQCKLYLLRLFIPWLVASSDSSSNSYQNKIINLGLICISLLSCIRNGDCMRFASDDSVPFCLPLIWNSSVLGILILICCAVCVVVSNNVAPLELGYGAWVSS